MPTRHILSIAFCTALPLLAVAVSADDKLAPKPSNKATETPKTAKLEAGKNYVEKTSGFKMVVDDPDTDPPKTHKEEMKAQFEMVWVPGGEFTMGSPAGEAGREATEGPAHKVKVGGFWMAKFECGWDEFDTFWYDENFLKADNLAAQKFGPDAVTRPTNAFVDATYGHPRDGHPALCMTHHAAMMYCNWLQKKTGRAYRLPTEAEWEYAARGGKGDTAYFFGNDPKGLTDYAWFKDTSPTDDKPAGTTHKSGTKKPNPFGLYDMYGNVWEWTLDQHDPKAYEKFAKNPLSLGPVTLPTDEKWAHVVRGGSWADKADRCRSAARRVSDKSWMKWDPQEPQSIWWLTRMDVIGFRVVLAESEQPELVGLKPKVVKKSE
ncbi:formylglycine-generating enzyme family protein [Gemmata sp. JC673]|uniref:Formylglycine-generating enzyme family protein n=1 Tax=Gemmata algarum TaxID=2975278 RepID=A0ABU5F743_9BACT|nr:SUMF1/EgtB/PvdO family nonheme iron enzyme [Gemmata algarum]MDY3562943.1 formylglycine-generating enzyme family protein [Gemmata algarum]